MNDDIGDDIYGVSRPVTPTAQSLQKNAAAVAFYQLSDDIVEQILVACQPDAFASAALLDSRWRRVSSQTFLYNLQIARCHLLCNTSYMRPALYLDEAKATFAKHVKRQLFEAYLRPRSTVVNLVSTSTASSAAFPDGDALQFSFSVAGRRALAYSSSRIYVLNIETTSPRVVKELKVSRRPAAATILDDATLLAVLSSDHQIDVYDAKASPPRHIKSISLNHPPRTIALSPTGAVLAAAYDGGVELYSLHHDATVADRRAVKCDAIDSLCFSEDGTLLLGTTLVAKRPATVVLSAPYFDPGGSSGRDSISRMWTTSIIFPNSSRDCSHAVLLPPSDDDEHSWIFTYDRVFEIFRAVKADDMRNGTTYFTGPLGQVSSTARLVPSTLPSASIHGDLVAVAFEGKDVWLCGVPQDKTKVPESEQEPLSREGGVAHTDSSASRQSQYTLPNSSSSRIPQWQVLCDKNKNMFVEGRKIAELVGVSAVKWVHKSGSAGERLVAVAPGILSHRLESDQDGVLAIDGGRLVLLDFIYGTTNGTAELLTIEVGNIEPEILDEQRLDFEAEIALLRRRTIVQRRAIGSGALTALAPTSDTDNELLSSMPGRSSMAAAPRPSDAIQIYTRSGASSPSSNDDEQEVPYAQGEPRASETLRRAATAAAYNRRLNPRRIVQDVQIRRVDGREEHPHESDADDWRPPPPPYTKEAISPLPEHLRNAVMTGSIPYTPTTLRRSSSQRTSSSVISAEANDVLSLSRSRTMCQIGGNSPSVSLLRERARSVSTLASLGAQSSTSSELIWQQRRSAADVPREPEISPTRSSEAVSMRTSRMMWAYNNEATSLHSMQSEPLIPHTLDSTHGQQSSNSSSGLSTSPTTGVPQVVTQQSPQENYFTCQTVMQSQQHQPDDLSADSLVIQTSTRIPKQLVHASQPAPVAYCDYASATTYRTQPGPTTAVFVAQEVAVQPPASPDIKQTQTSSVSSHFSSTKASLANIPFHQEISVQSPIPLSAALNNRHLSDDPKNHVVTDGSTCHSYPAGILAEVSNIESINPVTGPSSAQLARLSSRSGRPNSRALTDPSRSERAGSVSSNMSSVSLDSLQSRRSTRSPRAVRNARPVSSTIAPSSQSPQQVSEASRSPAAQTVRLDTRTARHDFEPFSQNIPITDATTPSFSTRTQEAFGAYPAGSGTYAIKPIPRSIGYSSSIAELRPRPTRLDTIHSVASVAERQGSRASWASGAGGLVLGRVGSRLGRKASRTSRRGSSGHNAAGSDIIVEDERDVISRGIVSKVKTRRSWRNGGRKVNSGIDRSMPAGAHSIRSASAPINMRRSGRTTRGGQDNAVGWGAREKKEKRCIVM